MPELSQIPPVFPETGQSLNPDQQPSTSRQAVPWEKVLGTAEVAQESAPEAEGTITHTPPDEVSPPVAVIEEPGAVLEVSTTDGPADSAITPPIVLLNAAIRDPSTPIIVSLAQGVRDTHTTSSLPPEAHVGL